MELTSTGYVIPQVVSQVAAKVPGRVIEVRVVQGQQVAAGDVLLVLDTVDQRAAIAAARSRVATQHAADSTAAAGAAWIARSLNTVAMNNVTQARYLALANTLDALPLAVSAALDEQRFLRDTLRRLRPGSSKDLLQRDPLQLDAEHALQHALVEVTGVESLG